MTCMAVRGIDLHCVFTELLVIGFGFVEVAKDILFVKN